MFKKIGDFFKMVSFDTIQFTDNVRSLANWLIFWTILGTIVPDVLSFALKGAENNIKEGKPVWAVICIIFYFSKEVLESIGITFIEYKNDNFTNITTQETTNIILSISNLIKNKVFRKTDDRYESIELPEIIMKSKDFIGDYWNFQIKVPTTIAQILILFITLVASAIVELKTSSVTETIIITTLIIICLIIYFLFSLNRRSVLKAYRETEKKCKSRIEVLMTELKTIDFMTSDDFTYHAERIRNALKENNQIMIDENLKLNKVFIKRTFITSIVMILIIVVKMIIGTDISMEAFVSVIASSTVYSTILERIACIANSYDGIINLMIDIKSLYPDFNNYYNVYKSELKKLIISTPIETITVTNFSVSQDKNKAYQLINKCIFSLKSGDIVMAYGRTGAGKSTLINMFTGKLNLVKSPIHFSNGQNGYLNSIAYQTDKSMANHFVINELTLTDDYDNIDTSKLMYLLKGFRLFDEILKMTKDITNISDEEKVLEILKVRKTSEFSSGQKQRLALVKLFYLLDEKIQLVCLDEPFNRLDDVTADAAMEFVKTLMPQNAILIIATHQVEICRKYCNMEISFHEDGETSIIKVAPTK